MASKRKDESNQPELPMRGSKSAPASEGASPGGKGAPAAVNGNGNGETHIKAEDVPAEVVHHRPFVPSERELELHKRVDTNFLQYASYVIRDRAIPNIEDGLKPVQRRILWALRTMDDGRFMKVLSVQGETSKYHPHGDASIGDAIVNLTNKQIGRA